MEYKYQNSVADKAHKVVLNEFNLTLYCEGQTTVIPYSNIIEVRLLRKSDGNFVSTLTTIDDKTITISNKSFVDKLPQDQSRNYTTFIRVLHFHLKDKSRASFNAGLKSGRLWLWLALSIAFSFALSFGSYYYKVNLVNPYIQAAVLAILISVAIVAVYISRWPKQYSPGDIPLELLP